MAMALATINRNDPSKMDTMAIWLMDLGACGNESGALMLAQVLMGCRGDWGKMFDALKARDWDPRKADKIALAICDRIKATPGW